MVACEAISTSPVFPCRQPTVQQSTPAASVSVSRLHDTNCSSNSASPWLSKEHGISNGKTTMKTAAQSGCELHFINFVFTVFREWVSVHMNPLNVNCWTNIDCCQGHC